jgi:hypothetical protein
VSSIALIANMKPTIALIAENKLKFWFTGAAATRNSVASKSTGFTFRFAPASRTRPACTLPSSPGVQDAVQAVTHSRKRLRVRQGSDSDGAVRECSDRGRVQFCADERPNAARYASEQTTGGPLARVGVTQLNDPAGRSQVEVDIVGVRAGKAAKVGLLGEAKLQAAKAGAGVLARLEHARELLARRAAVDAEVKLMVFSANGFDRALLAAAGDREDVELVNLERIYMGE